MSDDTGKALVGVTFVFAIALVIWDELKNNHRVPLPKRFVGAGLIWGTLGLVGPFITYPLAGVLGMGFVVALLYQHWSINRGGTAVGSAAGDAASGVGGSIVGGAAGEYFAQPQQRMPR